jgi:glutamate N-acetyltransferase/amino-acid N-acetyltransferase
MTTSPDASYRAELERRGRLPAGFLTSRATLRFSPRERAASKPYQMNLGLLVTEEPTEQFGAVFTSNRFCGAPVEIGRSLLEAPASRGVIVNNKIANVGVAEGLSASRRIAEEVESALEADSGRLFPVSTGIIGWALPTQAMSEHIPDLVSNAHSGSAVDFAEAIMTTDRFAKVRDREVDGARIVGVAKGAGMVEPNLATMLVFIVSDADLGREGCRRALSHAVSASFNRISVDSDQSTSDGAYIFCSGRSGAVEERRFTEALTELCSELAEDVVRNGEGTGHVIRVRVRGAESDDSATEFGKAIVNSPLVKTAVCGNDPNVGRIMAACGNHASRFDRSFEPKRTTLEIAGRTVFSEGHFILSNETEQELAGALSEASFDPTLKGYPEHDRCVDIAVTLGPGRGEAVVIGSDLTYEYVRENADYRS